MRLLYAVVTLLLLPFLAILLDAMFTGLNLGRAALSKVDPELSNVLDYKGPVNPYTLYKPLVYTVASVLAIMVALIIANSLRREER